jgi:Flp pilus assembly pilin Flp
MRHFATFRSRLAHGFARLFADRGGATAIEYGLMVALIGLAIMSTIVGVGDGIKTTLYGGIVNALSSGSK